MPNVLRVAIFIDGNFLYHVSNYYKYVHAIKDRISIKGLMEYIRKEVAKFEDVQLDTVTISKAQYYRGRLSAAEANSKNMLLTERKFDEVLQNADVTPVYFPLSSEGGEKGVDVALALEAYRSATLENIDVVVLIAGDGDYIPLISMLKREGKKTLVVGCNFEFIDSSNTSRNTRTAAKLVADATYSFKLNEIIDKGDKEITREIFLNG